MQTYWLDMKSTNSSASCGSEHQDEELSPSEEVNKNETVITGALCEKHLRLVSWNTEIIVKLLKEVLAHREASSVKPDSFAAIRLAEKEQLQCNLIVLEEVQDVIALPKFDAEAAKSQKMVCSIDLEETVKEQLENYIQTLAAMYHANPFHNFEHASHVTMSVVKLLSRIVAPSEIDTGNDQDLHDHTYGITSDPLTQFSVVLSALIHDVDHYGMSVQWRHLSCLFAIKPYNHDLLVTFY